MNTSYAIDLSLKPTTFDLWHVCLAGTVALLALLLIILLLIMLVGATRRRNLPPLEPVDPEIQIVEKIVEVEKIVPGPTPEPVILKEATPDAALQVLALLQKEARFIDFAKEDLNAYSDAEIGATARVVHDGCKKVINEYFSLTTIRPEPEGTRITLPKDFDPAEIRMTGNIVGRAPFTGTLVHKGWQVTGIRLPKRTQVHNSRVLAAAEVEL